MRRRVIKAAVVVVALLLISRLSTESAASCEFPGETSGVTVDASAVGSVTQICLLDRCSDNTDNLTVNLIGERPIALRFHVTVESAPGSFETAFHRVDTACSPAADDVLMVFEADASFETTVTPKDSLGGQP